MRQRGGGGWPPFHCVIVHLSEAYPRGDIGFVVEGRDDDLGAGGKIKDKGEVGEKLGR